MITALPSPPSTSDPANFTAKADALLGALPGFVTEANATAVAMNLNSTTDTSASSVAIGTGAKSFTVSAGKSFQPGMYLVIADTAAPSTNSMFGQITSYDVATGALVMNIIATVGSGTKTAWVISQSSAGVEASGAASRVQGLVGAPNAAAPLTKYDLSADSAVLRSASGRTVARYVTGTITNDFGLAGVTANGRDQAAVFAINSWVYLYFIWNGTTLATISSLALPTVGPALPTGYTHWAFATALRWNASSNIIPAKTRGGLIDYDIATGGVTRVLSSGASTAYAGLTLSGLVPPIALMTNLFVNLFVQTAGSTEVGLYLRSTGGGAAKLVSSVVTAAGVTAGNSGFTTIVPGTSQGIDYQLGVSVSSGGASIEVLGFTVPNGDA